MMILFEYYYCGPILTAVNGGSARTLAKTAQRQLEDRVVKTSDGDLEPNHCLGAGRQIDVMWE